MRSHTAGRAEDHTSSVESGGNLIRHGWSDGPYGNDRPAPERLQRPAKLPYGHSTSRGGARVHRRLSTRTCGLPHPRRRNGRLSRQLAAMQTAGASPSRDSGSFCSAPAACALGWDKPTTSFGNGLHHWYEPPATDLREDRRRLRHQRRPVHPRVPCSTTSPSANWRTRRAMHWGGCRRAATTNCGWRSWSSPNGGSSTALIVAVPLLIRLPHPAIGSEPGGTASFHSRANVVLDVVATPFVASQRNPPQHPTGTMPGYGPSNSASRHGALATSNSLHSLDRLGPSSRLGCRSCLTQCCCPIVGIRLVFDRCVPPRAPTPST